MIINTLSMGVRDLDTSDAAITPDGTLLYVIHRNDQSLSVLRLSDNTFVAFCLPLFDAPAMQIVMAPDGLRVYATQTNFSTNTSYLLSILTADNTVERKVALGGHPTDIAVEPDGAFIYLPMQSNEVVAIRTGSVANFAQRVLEDKLSPVGGRIMRPERRTVRPH
jgi:DNA-binding beta-propeller fold protein YncE